MGKSRNGTPSTEKVMHDWTGNYQPERPAGLYAEPYGNNPQPARDPAGVPVASPRVPGADVVQWDYQDMRPSSVPVVQADASMPGPFARSIEAHVSLSQMRHDRASQPHLAGQLGANAPMGPEGAGRQMPGAREVATAGNHPDTPASPAPHANHTRDRGIFNIAKLLATAQTTAPASVPFGDRTPDQKHGPVPDVAAPGRDFGDYHPGGADRAAVVPSLPAGWQYTSRPPGGD